VFRVLVASSGVRVAGDDVGSVATRLVVVSALCLGVGASLGFIPGFIATTLRDDLGISRVQVGLLVSVHFGCTGLGSVLAARLTETFGARIVIVADMVIVAVSALFGAAVGQYWGLLVVAVVAGAAYSLINVGTNVAIGRAVPATRRTTAMSIKTAGVPLMAVVAGGAGPIVAAEFGWRFILVAIACVAAAAATIATLTFQDDRPTSVTQRTEAALPSGFYWFPIGAFLLIAGSQPLYSWTIAYLEQSLDAAPGLAGGISAGASAIGIVIMIANARVADREGPEARLRRLILLIAINAAATLLVLVGELFGIAVVAIGVVVGIGAQLAAIGTMHAAVVDRAPHAVARATGVTMTGYYIGALASPAAFGALADATDTFAWSWGATTALLVVALPVWAIAGRTPRPSPEPGAAVSI
jgi:predicted MFS family arabinose efflux permease